MKLEVYKTKLQDICDIHVALVPEIIINAWINYDVRNPKSFVNVWCDHIYHEVLLRH